MWSKEITQIAWKVWVISTLSLSLLSCGQGSNGMSPTSPPLQPPPPQTTSLKVGRAMLNITPEIGAPIPLSGYSGREGPFSGIHDELFVRAIILHDGEDFAVYVSTDQLRIDSGDFKIILDVLAERGINIPTENYMVSATHTHGAPSTGGAPNIETKNYQDSRIEKIIDAIAQAYDTLEPATVRIGSIHDPNFNNNRQEIIGTDATGRPICDLGQNRDGISDKEIQFAEFLNANNQSIGSLVLAGVHSTAMGQHNTYVTGDFAGAMSTHIQELRGNDHISLWMMSGGGDQSPEYYHQKTEAFQDAVRSPEGQTRDLSEILVRSMDTAPSLTNIDIKADVEFVELQTKDSGPSTRAIYIHSWTNDVAILATPFELFAETVLNLKAKSPFQTLFVSSKTNGSAFYLPTERSAGNGCYENIVSLFPSSAEPIFTISALDLMARASANRP